MTDINRNSVTTSAPLLHVTARVESNTPIGYRLARYRTPEGAVHLKLQGNYQWIQGTDTGNEWRDIETVDLDQEAK